MNTVDTLQANSSSHQMNEAGGGPARKLSKLPALVFMFVLAYAMALNLHLAIAPHLVRGSLVEPDDAYNIIARSKQIDSSPWQDAPALRDIKAQIAQAPPIIGTRVFARLFAQYSPLYNVALWLLHRIGLSWFAAFVVLQATATAITCAGIAFFLCVTIGHFPAAVALLFITCFPLTSMDNTKILSCSLSTGVAFWLAGCLSLKRDRAFRVVLFGSVLISALHALGQVMALAMLILYCLFYWRHLDRRKGLWLFAVLVLAGYRLWLPFLIDAPYTGVPAAHLSDEAWTHYFWANLETTYGMLLHMSRSFTHKRWYLPQGTGLFLLVCIVGLANKNRRYGLKIIGVFFCLLACALAASLLFVTAHPGTVSVRIWWPMSILIFAAFGVGGVQCFTLLGRRILARFRTRHETSPSPLVNAMTIACLALLSAFIACFLYWQVRRNLWFYQASYAAKTQRLTAKLGPEPVEILLRETKPKDRILYVDEIACYFALSHGALSRKAALWPLLEGRSWAEIDPFLRNLRYTLAPHPLVGHFPHAGWNGGARIGDQLSCRILLPETIGASSLHLELRALDSDSSGVVRIVLQSDGVDLVTELVEVRDPEGEWLRVHIPEGVKEVLLQTDQSICLLTGLRMDPASPLQWAWDKGISLQLVRSGEQPVVHTVSLDRQSLAPANAPLGRIVNDSTSLVLLEHSGTSEDPPGKIRRPPE